MKIGSLITMYSTICFLSVCFPEAEVYIHPWLDLVEAVALGSFFLLLCEFVSPNHEQRYVFFATKRMDGVQWFKVRQIPNPSEVPRGHMLTCEKRSPDGL